MIKHGKEFIKNYMTLTHDFIGMRLQEEMLLPVQWSFSLDLAIPHNNKKTKEDIQKNIIISYQKIKFWLEAALNNVVIFDATDEEDFILAHSLSNNILFCPGNPEDDDLIARLLHSKIISISNDNFIVGKIVLSSSDTPLKYIFEPTNEQYDLPNKVTDYFDVENLKFDIPWWKRNDGFSIELILPDTQESQENEPESELEDPLLEFDNFIKEMSNNPELNIKEPAKIIQVEKWKPKII